MSENDPITGFFEKDHDEIDAILASVDYDAPEKGAERMGEFDLRLERHIVWEETILFPAAARLAPPLEHGPIAVMREEHKSIRALKGAALAALRAGDGAAARDKVRQLTSVLGPHNMKEEQILYPMCDRLLAGAGAQAVLEEVGA